MNLYELKQKVKTIPNAPGCYLYYNNDRRVIYVGKAKNLHNRVRSYFIKLTNFKTTQLVRDIFEIDYIVTNTEQEALILEHNLIKKYHPRYNIALTDSRHYPYIVITDSKNPSYLYVRKLTKNYLRSYGPFPDGTKAREILKTLERIYPLWRCQKRSIQPCLFFHINQCSGACFQKVPWSYYEKMIKKIDSFFSGDLSDVKNILTKHMEKAAANLQFEEAQKIKELINKIIWSLNEQSVELDLKTDCDFVSFESDGDLIVFTTMFYRNGSLLNKTNMVYNLTFDSVDNVVNLYIQELYSKNKLPITIFLDPRINYDDLKLLYNNLISYPKEKLEHTIIELAHKNSIELLKQIKLNQTSPIINQKEIMEELSKLLNLSHYPGHIEIFDISNIYDEDVIGACAVYKNGIKSTRDWRKYNLVLTKNSDFARMQFLLEKHYQKYLLKNIPLPNLVIMDGGAIQVQAAHLAYKTLGIEIPTIGLIKNRYHRTEYILDLNNNKISINSHSKLFNWLTMAQDDVHNFAIKQFRKKHAQNNQNSVLLNVAGISERINIALYKNFNNLSQMQNATFEELNLVIKNKTTTKNLQEFLSNYVNKI